MFLPIYWLYLWQIKEYHWFRLKSHIVLLPASEKLRLFTWGWYRRPTFTKKLIILLLTSMCVSFLVAWFIALMFGVGWSAFIIGCLIAWLSSPYIVSSIVLLFSVVERPIKGHIVRSAHKKAAEVLRNTRVIGVTGSYGKTTTKEFIAQLVSKKYAVVKTPEHVNQTLPMANFINASLTSPPEVFVMEFAAYRRGDIAYDAKYVVTPDWAVITGIGPQHLEFFGSIENTIRAKFELAQALPPDGALFYNADDECVKQGLTYAQHVDIFAFSAGDADEYFDKATWRHTVKGVVFKEIFRSNLAAAIHVAKQLMVSEADIQDAVNELAWLPKTLDVFENEQGAFIDDSYSANLLGMEALFRAVESLGYDKKILITPGIIELGEKAYDINQQIAQKSATIFDAIYVTNTSNFDAWHSVAENVSFGTGEEIEEHVVNFEKCVIVLSGRVPSSVHSYVTALWQNS